MIPPRRRPGSDAVPRIGTERVCGTAAGIAPRLIHSVDPELPGELDDGVGELPPAVVGLRAGQDEQVALTDPRGSQEELRPDDLGQPAVHDVERGPARPVVEEAVRLEPGDHPGVGRERAERGRRGRARIDPAIEGGDETRGDRVARIDHLIEAHGPRIGDGGYTPRTRAPHIGATKGRIVAKHSKYEKARRTAETERVKQIEAAWVGSLTPAAAKAFNESVAVRPRPRARGEAPDMAPGTAPRPPRPGHEPKAPKEERPRRASNRD